MQVLVGRLLLSASWMPWAPLSSPFFEFCHTKGEESPWVTVEHSWAVFVGRLGLSLSILPKKASWKPRK